MAQDRRLELLKKLNPTVVTQSVADDAKWAAEAIELLATYMLSMPGLGKYVAKDARLRDVMERVQ